MPAGILPRGGWGHAKPPAGTAIDWGNPLTAGLIRSWLVNEAGGKMLSDGAKNYPSYLTTVTTAPAWRPGLRGMGVSFTDLASYAQPTGPVVNTAKVTIEALVRYDSSPGGSQTPRDLIGFVDGHGSGTQDKVLSIYRDGEPRAFAYDGANRDIFGSAQIAIGTTTHLVMTADGTNLTLYRNGVQVAQVACGDTYTSYTQPNIVIGALSGSSGSTVTIFVARVWTRALRPGEIMTLAADPFCIYAPPVWRRYFMPSVSGAAATSLPPIRPSVSHLIGR
jgi:hypothetical protein